MKQTFLPMKQPVHLDMIWVTEASRVSKAAMAPRFFECRLEGDMTKIKAVWCCQGQRRCFMTSVLLVQAVFASVASAAPPPGAVTSAPAANTPAGHNCDEAEILQPGKCDGDELDEKEKQLAALINQYRSRNHLPAIPLSPSLSVVANRHVRDMYLNLKTLSHDWSNCPVSQDWNCMWGAPQRLGTHYPGQGYENAFGSQEWSIANVADILEAWKEHGNGPHNDVILNRAMWQHKKWQALGIGIYQGYAVMWVGSEVDVADTTI